MRCKLEQQHDKVYVITERKVLWEGPEGTRTPEPTETAYPNGVFRAGAYPYLHPRQLTAVPMGKKGVYRSGYGQKVFEYKERFPCFDSYDRMHEDRYYHWAYLIHMDRVYCVAWRDECREVTVTSDAAKIPGDHYKAMREAGVVDAEDHLEL